MTRITFPASEMAPVSTSADGNSTTQRMEWTAAHLSITATGHGGSVTAFALSLTPDLLAQLGRRSKRR